MARILLISDTHLGLDMPARPRVQMRRRGPDFLANYRRALDAALELGADCIVHGGDLFWRSRIADAVVEAAFEPLRRIADAGLPVFIIPGNHERSRIPRDLLAIHPRIHVFDRPRTYVLEDHGLALSGFPFVRRGIRLSFPGIIELTQWRVPDAPLRVLCMHQCVEGAVVGPAGHVFRDADDVVMTTDFPQGIAAVLCGHVHRHQVIERDLSGRPLHAPIFYPGSTERTSFAEREEVKGFLVIDLDGKVAGWRFHPLPTRPMVRLEADVTGLDGAGLRAWLAHAMGDLAEDSIVKLRIRGRLAPSASAALAASSLRALSPTMNVTVDLGCEACVA